MYQTNFDFPTPPARPQLPASPSRWQSAGLPTPNVTVTPTIDPATAAALESLRADAAIVAHAAQQVGAQAPSAAQSAATASQGIGQVGQAAPGISQGLNTVGTGIHATSSSIGQVGQGVTYAANAALTAQQRTEAFARQAALTVLFVGLAVAAAAVIFAPPARKSNGGRASGRRGV